MFYNTENFFDVYKDSIKDDKEFLPDGLRRWNKTRYDRKINSLYKTIVAAGEWSPPEIVALSEVENRNVLIDLIDGTYLSKYNYEIIHQESPDPRGIDVCLIYRKGFIKVIKYSYLIPSGISRQAFSSRTVLYVKFSFDSDTVHLFVNHWPSRRGGVLAGEELRVKIAAMIRFKADSINRSTKDRAKIIVTGDFNCTPDDLEIKALRGANKEQNRNSLINLSERQSESGIGTYRYMGSWEMIDQVLVSSSFLSCKSGLFTDFKMVNVFSPDFLLTKDPKYPGLTPLSTYRGFRYQGGFSDHLPVLVKFGLRN